jgi:hypothetical protein
MGLLDALLSVDDRSRRTIAVGDQQRVFFGRDDAVVSRYRRVVENDIIFRGASDGDLAIEVDGFAGGKQEQSAV